MLKQNSGLKGIQAAVGSTLAKLPISANAWTGLSLLAAIIGAGAIAYGTLYLGLALFALAALFDAVDGAVARAKNEVTDLGGFIDGVVDRFVEFFFLFSFMFYPLPTIYLDPRVWIALLIFVGTCMPAFIRAYADHKGVLSREKALALGGIFERSERLLVLLAGLAIGIAFSMEFFVYAIILASLLSMITIMQRFLAVLASK